MFTIDKILEKGSGTFRRILIGQDVEHLR
jgi:hypothetical protein